MDQTNCIHSFTANVRLPDLSVFHGIARREMPCHARTYLSQQSDGERYPRPTVLERVRAKERERVRKRTPFRVEPWALTCDGQIDIDVFMSELMRHIRTVELASSMQVPRPHKASRHMPQDSPAS